MKNFIVIVLALMAVVAPQRASAQLERPSIANWSYDRLYRDGWSVRALYESTTVVGPYGDDIGSLENIILSNRGEVLGVIAEIGGLWDIGDTHLYIPWEKVRVNARFDRITVPVTSDTADRFNFTDTDLWKSELQRMQSVDSSGFSTGPSIFKVSEVLGDYAYLSDRTGYGYVYDLIISRSGQVHAIVVNADSAYGGGYRALPWPGYAGVGTGPYYNIGYPRADVERLGRFDYNRINGGAAIRNDGRVPAAGSYGAAATGAGTGAPSRP